MLTTNIRKIAVAVFLSCSAFLLSSEISSAAVEVFKSIDGNLTEVESGKDFKYVIQYRNPSTTISEFENVKITDVLPESVEYRGFEGTTDVDSVSYDKSTRTVTVHFVDPLEDGKTGEVKLRVRFKPGETADGTVAINEATIDADNSPADTSAPVSITARASNLAKLQKTLIGSSVPLDQDVTYQIRIDNRQDLGGLNLESITLTDQLPAGAQFVSASGNGSYNLGSETVTWTRSLVQVDKRVTETLTVRYPSTTFSVGDSITNTSTLSATGVGGVSVNLEDSDTRTIANANSNLYFRKFVNTKYAYEGKSVYKTWNFDLQNRGTVPLEDVVVTDMIPSTFDVTRFQVPKFTGKPSGLNDTVSVYYQTEQGGNTWHSVPGNPFSGSKQKTIRVSNLGLNSGDYITGIQWDVGHIPVGYKESNMTIAGNVLTSDRSGTPVVAGDTIYNEGVIDYRTPDGLQNGSDGASIPIKTARPLLELEKRANSKVFADGDQITYAIRLRNHSQAAEALENPVLVDFLDSRLEYVPGSWRFTGRPAGAPDPIFEQIDDYKGTGRTLLRWSWTGASAFDLAINSSLRIDFDVDVPRGTAYGRIDNYAYLTDWENQEVERFRGGNWTRDTLDFNEDGNDFDEIYRDRYSITVAGRASMDSVKWVQGQLDDAESRFPDSGETVPGGMADYRLVVENTGNVPIEDTEVLDILPIIGDSGVVDISPRGTEWPAALAGPVSAPSGVTVYYSRESNPERPDFQNNAVGATSPGWSTTPPATITEARALYFVFDGVTVDPGATFELNWPMRAPVGTPTDGRIAWNSFGYFGSRVDTGSTLLASEPNKVGIRVLPDNNAGYGDFIWLDSNQNGVQDPTEVGLNGIRVDLYEDGLYDPISDSYGFGDGVRDPSADRHVGFTITSDTFDGEPGYYLFPDLDRGSYYAVFTIPDTYTVTTADVGADDAVDSDVDLENVEGSYTKGFTPVTELSPAEHDRSWDLGLWLPYTNVQIVKTAGPAADGDDLWIQPGSAVTYTYTVTNTGDLPLVRLTVTDDILGEIGRLDGPLAPTQSITFTKTADAIFSDVTNIGSVVAYAASATNEEIPGAPALTDDDDAVVLVYASIGSRVWFDANLDGIYDLAESPAVGVSVRLLDSNGAAVSSTTTGADGTFLFDDLIPGDYSLEFVAPAGYVFSSQNEGGDPLRDSDADQVTGKTTVTTLVGGEQDLSWFAGLWEEASLGDRVWIDVDADGIQDAGEKGIAGVVVNLMNATGSAIFDANGSAVSTTSSSDGAYEFTGLIPGDYRVEFVKPTTHVFSPTDADTVGILGGENSDADSTTGLTGIITLESGDSVDSVDAGLVPANAAISIVKTVSPETYDTDGEILSYSFAVRNTGDTDLVNVVVTDPLFPVSGDPISLAPGEVDTTTFTGSYAVNLADLNAGERPNTAQVTAEVLGTGAPVDDSDDATATAIQLPELELTKTGVYSAVAGACNPLGSASEFNALIFGDLDATGGDTEYRLGVAGNFTYNNSTYSVGFSTGAGDPIPDYTGATTDIFIVGGDLADGVFGVNGNIVYAGTRSGPNRVMSDGNLLRKLTPIRIDGNGNVPRDGSGLTFSEIKSEMRVRSALIEAFEERGVVSETKDEVGHTLALVGNDPDLNIFEVTADWLSGTGFTYSIDVPADSVTIINVHGETVSIQGGAMNLGVVDPRKVLFNFVDATSFEMNSFTLWGSVLAPYADANFEGGTINGQSIIGGNVTAISGFQFNHFAFDGGVCSQIDYSFTVTNTGNVSVTGIEIDDPYATVSGGPVDLDPGQVDTSTFTASYRIDASNVVNGAFTNTAIASGLSPASATVSTSGSDTQTFSVLEIGIEGESGGNAPVGPPFEETSNGELSDLQIQSVSFLPNNVVWDAGDEITVVVEVKNVGLWGADDSVLRLWNLRPTSAAIGEAGDAEVHLGRMDVDETKTVIVGGFTTPEEDGNYKLHVFVDADGEIDEQSEENNQLAGTYTVQDPDNAAVQSWMRPDFVVQTVELDPSPTIAFAQFDATIRITNEGDIAGDAGELGLWVSSFSWSGLASTPDQTFSVGSIEPGEVIEISFFDLRAPEDEGTFHTRVIVDHDDMVEEYSNGNNSGGATYTVFPIQAQIEETVDGMVVTWDSVAGFNYYVERGESLTDDFVDISGALPAEPPENSFTDDSVPTGGSVFYRVWGESEL